MAIVAEPALDFIDDRLAGRNALILAVAQALAGGNNTVIVATTGIIGSMLAPNRGWRLCRSASWSRACRWGRPVGMLAKAYGRRFAVQTGSAFGALSGLISCAAVLHGSFWLLLVGTLCGGLYASAHQSYRSPPPIRRARSFGPRPSPGCWPAASSPP